MVTNFGFLEEKYFDIYNDITTGEFVLFRNPTNTIGLCRKVIEAGLKNICNIEGIDSNIGLHELINEADLDLDSEIKIYLNKIKTMGNNAVHYSTRIFTIDEALSVLRITYIFCKYLYENYVIYYEQEFIEDFDEHIYKDMPLANDYDFSLFKSKSIEEIAINMKKASVRPEGIKKTFDKSIITEKDKERLLVWSEDKETSEALKKDFSEWKIFLHPKQNLIIKRSYNGPVLVEGGPGTGKTIVGIYRALELSSTIYPATEGKKIVFLTYLNNLVEDIKNDVSKIFLNHEIDNNVEVKGISIFFLDVMRTINKKAFYNFYLTNDIKGLCVGTDINVSFLEQEYREVILRKKIDNFDSYKENNSNFNRELLDDKNLRVIWEHLIKIKEARKNKFDSEELCLVLLDYLNNGLIQPLYDSIIIDETQDLTSIQIEILSRLVKRKRNSLFFLSDPYQKIYNNENYNNTLKFDFFKRKELLSINYRTTEQIKEYADIIFNSEENFVNKYKLENLLIGKKVEISKVTIEILADKVIEKIKKLQQSYCNSEIGIITYKNSEIDHIKKKAKRLNIEVTQIGKDVSILQDDAINITTYHGSKGLEFKSVILILRKNILIEDTPYKKQEERKYQCLKYVASTRAREVLEILELD